MTKLTEDLALPMSDGALRGLTLTQAMLLYAVPEWTEVMHSGPAVPRVAIAGDNYLSLCRSTEGETGDDGREAALEIPSVLEGAASNFSFENVRQDLLGDHRCQMRVTPVSETGLGALILHSDLAKKPRADEAFAANWNDRPPALPASSPALSEAAR
ncbi:MAG: hypothetical protein ABI702_13455 [Burkholderiales bacterium]